MTEITVNAKDYRRAIGQFATGVAVVSCLDAKARPVGITVNSLTSVSLDPPALLWCLGDDALYREAFTACSLFAVNILGEEQAGISNYFADPERTEWGDISWNSGEEGVPILPEISSYLLCQKEASWRYLDHLIILGRVKSCDVASETKPLLYFGGNYRKIDSDIDS